ncbi:MAG: EVE domain-containing protein [Nannocystales bacterium]
MAAKKQFWLMKSEPDAYSIDDLERDGSEPWDGIRNYQARNFMRAMNVGDLVLFYHSNAKPPGVVGVAKVCKTAYPDHTAWDAKSKYFDPKSPQDNPRWEMVDLEFVEKTPNIVSLADLKADPALTDMVVTQKSRLSVQPVGKEHFKHVLSVAGAKTKVR